MKTLMVQEKIRMRVRYDDSWSEWRETDDDFETACEKAKKAVQENGWATWQVAKFYYDTNGNYVAWNVGLVFDVCNCS